MNLAWEKIIIWVLAIVLILVLLYFMVQQLSPDKAGAIGNFFNITNQTGKTAVQNIPS